MGVREVLERAKRRLRDGGAGEAGAPDETTVQVGAQVGEDEPVPGDPEVLAAARAQGARDRVPLAEGSMPAGVTYQTAEEARRGAEVARKRGGEPSFPKFFALLNLGLILTAVSIVVFKTPNHFAFGGTSGMAVVLTAFFPNMPVSAFMWILNVVLVVLGLIFLDLRSVGWSVFASLALSGYTSLVELFYPTTASPTGDMWLDLCFAVLLPAIGSAIVFDIGASTGGTDILALILKKHTSLQIGRALLVVDIGIVAVAAFLYGPRVGLYCVLGLFAKTMVVDTAIESLHLRKVCTIICAHPALVEEFIVRELNRSATITQGYGAYLGKPVTILMSVLSRREAMRLRLFVRKVDPGAFMTIVNSSEIIGKGFRGV